MSEKVKVNISVDIEGSYYGQIELHRDEFERLDNLTHWELGNYLSDYVKWDDAQLSVDGVTTFEEAINE